ncbi:MAG: toll/interleukin-1 receptor domain-containing protein [Helicobacteraceae bacterium]|jgi:hypothetical protein|nr:toll/interleukin-1 receptor domain-containing protein [Helicobacteraceae bacterium]
MATTRPFAFISYAHQNARIVLAVVNRLTAAGYDIWCDREIGVSSTWTNEIARAIGDCAAFIVFVSIGSAGSLFVRSEIEFALRERKTIVPVYLDPVGKLPPGFALGLNSIQGVIGPGSAAIAEKLAAWFDQNNIPKSSEAYAREAKKRVLATAFVCLIALGGLTYAAAKFRPAIKEYLQTMSKEQASIAAIALAKERYAPAEPMTINLDKAVQKQSSNGAIASIAAVDAQDSVPFKEVSADEAKIVLRAPGETGEYEIRIRAKDDGEPIAIKRFFVVGNALGACRIAADKNVYNSREKIAAKVIGAKKDAIDGRMVVGVWRVWESGDNAIEKKIVDKKNVSLSFVAPSAIGRYEIRAYNNADILTDATLMAKVAISVRDLKK